MLAKSSSFCATSRRAWAISRSPGGASTSRRRLALEQTAVERLFQAFDLLAGGRLRAGELPRRRGDAARIDHRKEGAQKGGVEVSRHPPIISEYRTIISKTFDFVVCDPALA